MEKTILSSQFSLNWRDISRGFIMAVLTPAVVIIQESLKAGHLEFNWTQIGMAAVGGGLAYIVKNFFEPTKQIKPIK